MAPEGRGGGGLGASSLDFRKGNLGPGIESGTEEWTAEAGRARGASRRQVQGWGGYGRDGRLGE